MPGQPRHVVVMTVSGPSWQDPGRHGRAGKLSGTAQAVADRERAGRLWRPDFKAWFPGGKDDPNLIMLRVDGIEGEYWDNSGTGGLKYLVEVGKALVTGTRPKADDPTIHGKVTL